MLIELKSEDTITIAVLSDSHMPDRVDSLHPYLLNGLNELHPDFIFHAGDISIGSVLDQLKVIAPVYAVRGNRDVLLARSLPMHQVFKINGVKTSLTHGHKDFMTYWLDKVVNLLLHYHRQRYFIRLQEICPTAQVYLFGHSHHAENIWEEDKLFFNPGSCSAGEPPHFDISYGVVKFHPDGQVESELIALTGAKISLRRWKVMGKKNHENSE